MKIPALLILFLFLFSFGKSYSQNWEDVDPKMTNVIVDTTLVKATIATIEAGEKSSSHTHPAHFYYALTDGKIRVHYNDGTSAEFDLKAGDYGYSDPEKLHQTENIGTKTLKFLLVELKEYPYKK